MATTAYDSSIFKQFFESNDASVVTLRDNLMDKMYKRGIVPNYIVRGVNDNANGEDDDYIAFWTAVCEYFAYFVVYAREFLNIETNVDLLFDYLIDKGVGISPDSDLTLLQYITNNLYDDTRLRGTEKVFKKKFVNDPDIVDSVYPSDVVVHGELVRSVGYKDVDEFMYVLTSMTNFGWNIDRCSPLYKGTGFDYQLIKGYENTENAVSLAKYPIIGSGLVSIFTDTTISRNVLKILNTGNIGYDGSSPTKMIVIDMSINYEITCRIKSVGTTSADIAKISFGVDFFDQSFNLLASDYLDGTASSGLFFNNQAVWKDKKYYLLRGIAFGVNEPVRSAADSKLDYGVGKHIQIPCGARYMIPRIHMNGYNGSNIPYLLVHDFKVRISNTVYSKGFIQTPNVIQLWAKNNNGNYNTNLLELINVVHPISNRNVITIPLLEEFIKRYLIPYNSTILFNWLTDNNSCVTGIGGGGSFGESYNDSYD